MRVPINNRRYRIVTTATQAAIVSNRYDAMFLFDCKDGNPNGDPDMANMPRSDMETGHGLVSDGCLKRKIRNYVSVAKSQGGEIEPGYRIYIVSGESLESKQRLPYDDLKTLKGKANGTKAPSEYIQKARDWMCEKFYDIRTFGAVMNTTKFSCGQVRGPVQFTFSRSLDRIFSTEHALTRLCQTTESAQGEKNAGTFGDKHTVAYGLYMVPIFINPCFAQDTNFTEDDLALLWKALNNMFDLDRSATRGLMSCRGLWAFKHDSPLGNAQATQLFERIVVEAKEEVEFPRSFKDYTVKVNDSDLPTGVELLDLLDRNG
jgi:CRISPR-associated protein Csd2